MADRLTTPIVLFYWVFNAQIVNLYNDGVPERAFVGQVERVLGWGYSEATSASVTITVVSTECKLVDRGRESGSEIYAACCRKNNNIAISVWGRLRGGTTKHTTHTKINQIAYREVHSYEQM